jgi:glycosyltransferase involved in cell wall biosynthesis
MYHGMRFTAEGQCVEIPGQDVIPKSACIRTYPVAEQGSWAWIWMGDPNLADPALLPHARGLDDPEWVLKTGQLDYAAPHELINDNLDKSAYSALLSRTDLIVLPYRRDSYHNRLSRVAIEAAIHGIPLLPMSGTWAEDLSILAGGFVVIEDESPEAVAAGLIAALKSLDELKRSAQAGRGRVAAFHGATTFRSLLVQDIGNDPARAPVPNP